MTVDREQVRRDAEALIGVNPKLRFAGACLALLDELEQAERELDETRNRAEIAEIALEDARQNSVADLPALLNRVESYEAQLAAVPALVEAVRAIDEAWQKRIQQWEQAGGQDWWDAHTELYDALAAYEQAQRETT